MDGGSPPRQTLPERTSQGTGQVNDRMIEDITNQRRRRGKMSEEEEAREDECRTLLALDTTRIHISGRKAVAGNRYERKDMRGPGVRWPSKPIRGEGARGNWIEKRSEGKSK